MIDVYYENKCKYMYRGAHSTRYVNHYSILEFLNV